MYLTTTSTDANLEVMYALVTCNTKYQSKHVDFNPTKRPSCKGLAYIISNILQGYMFPINEALYS